MMVYVYMSDPGLRRQKNQELKVIRNYTVSSRPTFLKNGGGEESQWVGEVATQA